jgi:hypothetical protein
MMSVRTAARTTLVASIITVALASAALASADRTFVSGTGSDGNTGANCPLPSPCRSFAAAYSVTNLGGEIIALDSAGYGELNIIGPVSIIGALVASIQVTANSTGITISAGANDPIILRNLQINGGNAAGSVGIAVINSGGHLTLQNSTLKLLSTGLSVSGAKADLVDCDILDNGTGIFTNGPGPEFNTGGTNPGATEVRISGGNIIGNASAWTMNDSGLTAFGTGQNKTTIYLDGNGTGPNFPNVVGNAGYSVTGGGSSCSNHDGSNVCLPSSGYTYGNDNANFQ